MRKATTIHLIAALMTAGWAATVQAAAIGTAFTYQGRLDRDNEPVSDECDFQFRLYDAEIDGNQIGATVPIDALQIEDGLFTVLLDFGVSAFVGEARWIEIGVRCPSGLGRFVTLEPRQELTPTPHAVYASEAATATDLELPYEGETTAANCGFSIVNDSNSLWSSAICGTTLGSTGRGVVGVAKSETGINWGGWFQSNSESGRGVIGYAPAEEGTNFGVWGETASTGGSGVFGRATAESGFTHGGEFLSDSMNGRGVSGIATFDRDAATTYGVYGRSDSLSGRGVYGNADGNSAVGVYGISQQGIGVYGRTNSFENNEAGVVGYSGATSGQAPGVLGQAVSQIGTGVRGIGRWGVRGEGTSGGIGVYGESSGSTATGGYFRNSTDGVAVFADGNNGLPAMYAQGANNGVSASAFSHDDLVVEDTDAVLGLYSNTGGNWASAITMAQVDGNGALVDKWSIANTTAGEMRFLYGTDPGHAANPWIMRLHPDGRTIVRVLEITGADLAERFPATEQGEPGMVMEIDPDNAGNLRVSRGAYNRRVAGVVSGAGDIPVGAILGNLPGSEGSPAIALSGRVWVKCDASCGAIEPGDLLTTAALEGHAMKVNDNARATGATIGKAMTSLKEGQGLVLVLVNLQ